VQLRLFHDEVDTAIGNPAGRFQLPSAVTCPDPDVSTKQANRH
jgi:hypothetical protein